MSFNFMTGQPAQTQGYDPQAMQSYAPAWNTGQPQGMDYSQVLGGGQASPATQGLDYMKIGQWASQMAQSQQRPDWKSAIASMGATQPTQATPATYSPLQAHHAAVASQAVNQGAAGYIGNGTRSGLLGMMR